MIKGSADVTSVLAGLDKLSGASLTSLARSMAVAGGSVIRDEAKRQAPVDDGTLRDAIYLAYKDNKSNGERVVYSITWNAKKAPHGHLLEFGHWQPYVVIYNHNLGHFQTLAKGKGGGPRARLRPDGPKWITAKPFLRPAMSAMGAARQAMLERGRERLQEILRGGDGD